MTGLFAHFFSWRGQRPTPRSFASRPLSLSLASRVPSVPGSGVSGRGQQPTPRDDAVGDCFPVEVISGAFHVDRNAIGIDLSSTGNGGQLTAGAAR